jgi:ferredoxin
MTHHPHVHMIAPGGGLSAGGERWIACRRGFFLPVLVLSALFRRLMLEKLAAAHKAGKLRFSGEYAHLAGADAFAAFLAPLKKTDWFVYSKRPFSGPKAVLTYLSRYTHRVAISNRRLISADKRSVTFKYKDYRIEGPGRYKTMTLETGEFIRRFLMHVLPKGFHRIRHYGLLASGARADNLARMRALLAVEAPVSKRSDASKADASAPNVLAQPCPCCGDITRYTTFHCGPKRRGDADGPEEFHVVLVDNGRTQMLAAGQREMLRCIRCGACMNHCVVYRQIGGHAYGGTYPGPMGSVLTPVLSGLARFLDLPHACTLNGKCAEVCPVEIPLPSLLRGWRDRSWRAGLVPAGPRSMLAGWAFFARCPRLYRIAAAGIEPLIAMNRDSHHPSLSERFAGAPPAPENPTPVEVMAHRLKTPEGKKLYALRKCMPEPVFGIIKSVLGFR